MKKKIKLLILIISLFLNIFLIMTTIILNNNIKNIQEEIKKMNGTLKIQNQIITNIQQDYDELKTQIKK